MKSYWIAAAVFTVTAWPYSRASAMNAQQPLADGTPQSSASSANVKNSVQAAVTAKPAAAAAATVTPPAARAEETKPKSSYMLVELSKTLKANKLKVGDKVKAEVSQDVISRGKVIIPVETKLVGHVTEVSAKDSAHPESRLGIVFDRILLKHFRDIDFEAVVQAVSQPVVRRSLVDEPSQMLPPSMMGISRDATPTATGRGASTSNRSSGASSGGSNSTSLATYQTPFTVKESPSTHVNSSGALLETAATGKPMSIGMPQGIFGLKGLSLSTTPSVSTPGPIIVSNTGNIKLESGTQILLQVLKVEVPTNLKPAK